MPSTTTKTKTTTKKGKGLGKKYGPLPLWAYLGVGVIVLLYLYYRHKHNQTAASVSSTGGYVQPTPTSGVDVVPSGNANTTTGDTGTNSAQPVSFPTDYATQTDLQSAIDSIDSNTAAAIAGITFPTPTVKVNIQDSDAAKKTAASKVAAKAAAPSAPFGGIVRTQRTKSGSILTYYRSGRIVEKAPGKTAYVVHK